MRNKRKDEIDDLFEEPFCGVHSVPTEDAVLSKEQAKRIICQTTNSQCTKC